MAGPNDEEPGGLSANATLVIGLVVCAALVVVALLGSRFLKTEPPPPPPPVAAPVERSVNTTLKYTPGYYEATVQEDAKRYKLPPPTPAMLAAPLAYASELGAPHALKPEKDQLDTPHLHIATQVSKEWSQTGAAQRLRVEHVMLSITNKSARPIAYRVDTRITGDSTRCKSKGTFAHNAVALMPGETIRRSECLWSKGAGIELRSIEAMELSDLGYYYVSRLLPSNILLDERATAGHEPPMKLLPCSFVPWREIRSAAEPKDGVTWADVIDFYARHSCDEYSFFSSYRRWTSPGALPAQQGAALPPADAVPAAP